MLHLQLQNWLPLKTEFALKTRRHMSCGKMAEQKYKFESSAMLLCWAVASQENFGPEPFSMLLTFSIFNFDLK